MQLNATKLGQNLENKVSVYKRLTFVEISRIADEIKKQIHDECTFKPQIEGDAKIECDYESLNSKAIEQYLER